MRLRKNDCYSVWCRFGGVTGLSVRYTTGFILNETCNVNVNMGSKPLHMTENLARFYGIHQICHYKHTIEIEEES